MSFGARAEVPIRTARPTTIPGGPISAILRELAAVVARWRMVVPCQNRHLSCSSLWDLRRWLVHAASRAVKKHHARSIVTTNVLAARRASEVHTRGQTRVGFACRCKSHVAYSGDVSRALARTAPQRA